MKRYKMTDEQKWEVYFSLRDDISLMLCEMGRICDLHEHTKEYDSLYNEVAKKLVEIDHLVKDEYIFTKKEIKED